MEITNGPFARLADIVAQALQFRNVAKQVLLITMVSKNVKHLLRTGRFIRSTRRRLREHLRKSEPELQLVVSAMVCTTNSPRPTKTDEKKVVPTTQDSPTKKKLKKDEKNDGRRQTRFYERTPREPIIEWEKRILAREASVREKKAIVRARFERKSGVLLNHPYVAMSSPPKAQKGCRRRANPRNGEETVEASDAPHILRKGKRHHGDPEKAKGDAHSEPRLFIQSPLGAMAPSNQLQILESEFEES